MRATSGGEKQRADIRRESIDIGNLCKCLQRKQILLLFVRFPFRMNLGNTETCLQLLLIFIVNARIHCTDTKNNRLAVIETCF